MSSRIVDKGGFTSPVPSNIDESDPANDPPAPDEAAAADAAAVIAAEDKAQAKKEEEEEEADAIAPLSGGNVPTIPPPPACKNLDQLMSSLPPLPKLEDITPQTHGGCTYFVFHLLWTLSYQQRFYFPSPFPSLLIWVPFLLRLLDSSFHGRASMLPSLYLALGYMCIHVQHNN